MQTKKQLKNILVDAYANNSVRNAINKLLTYKKSYPLQPAKPKTIYSGTGDDYRIYADKLDIFNEEIISYKKNRNEIVLYNKLIDSVIQEFIRYESGVGNLLPSQQNKVWNKAWDDRHSEGYHAVFDELVELVELF